MCVHVCEGWTTCAHRAHGVYMGVNNFGLNQWVPSLNVRLNLENRSQNSFNKLLFMRCVHKSLVLSSNFVGISLNWPSVLGSTSSSTKKISFSLAFNAAHVSKLIGQRLVFKTLSAHPSSVLGVRLMWIISVCSLYVKLSIRQASTEIMLLCAKSCIMMFGWCILLVSAVSVKRINSAGIKCLLMMCMAAVATIL